MNFDEVKTVVDNGSHLIIDVRNQEEVTTHGRIPTAVNIPREY